MGKALYALTLLVAAFAIDITRWYATAELLGWPAAVGMLLGSIVISVLAKTLKS